MLDNPVRPERVRISHPQSTATQLQGDNLDVEHYTDFFREVAEEAQSTLELDASLLVAHAIQLTSSKFGDDTLQQLYRSPRVLLRNAERGASIIDYAVLLGPYIVVVRMLNVNERTFDQFGSYLGKGSFGSVLSLRDERE